jgi:filamentous hemagglutinin family protein
MVFLKNMQKRRIVYCLTRQLELVILCCVLVIGLCTTSHAQVETLITSDGTLPTPTDFGSDTAPNVIEIIDGTEVGTNLFHSFGRFELGAGDTADFVVPAGVQNILGRVTGGVRSDIDGDIQANGANLYLMNPSGIVIGPNASFINVSGSLHMTTADYIRLEDGNVFNAIPGLGDALLTTSPPAAFGFLDSDVAPIEMNGASLSVGTGETLSLIGGDINLLNSTVTAAGGRINVASVASAGEVIPVVSPDPGITIDGVTEFGDITVTDSALNAGNTGGQGGDIFIRGGNFFMEGGSSVAVDTGDGSEDAGLIEVNVTSLNSVGGIFSADAGQGGGGTIRFVDIENLTINGGEVRSIEDDGGGGTILFDNVGTLHITNGGRVFTENNLGPDGGGISATVDNLTLSNNGQISVSSTGLAPAGNISITASNRIDIDSTSSITATGSPASAENAGSLLLTADTIDVSGVVEAKASGLSGLTADQFEITGGTVIMRSGGKISTITDGDADGTDLNITGSTVTITGGEMSSSASGDGAGGNITISGDNITMDSGGKISSVSTGVGAAGSITVTAANEFRMEDSLIEMRADSSSGGDIDIRAGNAIKLLNSDIIASVALSGGSINFQANDLVHLLDSQISASVTGLSGSEVGGNISIDPRFITLNRSVLTARANTPNGGNISLTASCIITDLKSSLIGTVTINDGDLCKSCPIDQEMTEIVDIPAVSFAETGLTREQCSSSGAYQGSSFSIGPSDLPPSESQTYFRTPYMGVRIDSE